MLVIFQELLLSGGFMIFVYGEMTVDTIENAASCIDDVLHKFFTENIFKIINNINL